MKTFLMMNHPLLFIALAFTLHLSAQPAIITPEWTRFQAYDGNGTVGESPFALTDASGNVFFCGETYNPGPLIGMVTTKYSPDGTFLWESLFGTNAQDRVKSAVVDSDGHIYSHREVEMKKARMKAFFENFTEQFLETI